MDSDDQGLRGEHRPVRRATRASTWSRSRRASARTTSPTTTWPDLRATEGVLFVGKAQEKTATFRTEKRRNPDDRARPTRGSCEPPPWSTSSTSTASTTTSARSSSSSAPTSPTTPSCASTATSGPSARPPRPASTSRPSTTASRPVQDPHRLQRICDRLERREDRRVRPQVAGPILPHPFTAADRRAGYRYDISILQAEFSLTQVLDRPAHRTGVLRGGHP